MWPRFLWKQDSRRDRGEARVPLWPEHVPALGSVAGGGCWLLCKEMEKGALWMGSCLQSLEEPCEHCLGPRKKVSGHQSAAYGASQTYRQPPSTHTPTTFCTDLHWGRRRPSIWQSSIHTGTEQSTSGILFPHCQPVLRCDRVRTTGHNVPTNMFLPRGRTSPQVSIPCTWWWGHLALPSKGSSGGKAWCGEL